MLSCNVEINFTRIQLPGFISRFIADQRVDKQIQKYLHRHLVFDSKTFQKPKTQD